MATYSELIEDIKRYTNNDDEEKFIPAIPGMILRTEEQISKRLDITAEVVTDVTSDPIDAGTAFIPKPNLWRAAYQLRLIPEGTTEPIFLQFRSRSFCDLFWPDVTAPGQPRFYCDFSATSLKIVATLDQKYIAEHSYEAFITGLSVNTPQTWLSLNAYDLLLKGCLVEAAVFHKNPNARAVFKEEFEKALEDEKTQDLRQKLDNLSLSRM